MTAPAEEFLNKEPAFYFAAGTTQTVSGEGWAAIAAPRTSVCVGF